MSMDRATHVHIHLTMYTRTPAPTQMMSTILLHTEKADIQRLTLKRISVFNICRGKLLVERKCQVIFFPYFKLQAVFKTTTWEFLKAVLF